MFESLNVKNCILNTVIEKYRKPPSPKRLRVLVRKGYAFSVVCYAESAFFCQLSVNKTGYSPVMATLSKPGMPASASRLEV